MPLRHKADELMHNVIGCIWWSGGSYTWWCYSVVVITQDFDYVRFPETQVRTLVAALALDGYMFFFLLRLRSTCYRIVDTQLLIVYLNMERCIAVPSRCNRGVPYPTYANQDLAKAIEATRTLQRIIKSEYDHM